MEQAEIQKQISDIALDVSRLQGRMDQAEKDINILSESRSLLHRVDIALSEVGMSNKFFTEKLEELKAALNTINKDNKEQHEAISGRVKNLEEKPARSWDKLIWIIVGLLAGFVINYVANGLMAK